MGPSNEETVRIAQKGKGKGKISSQMVKSQREPNYSNTKDVEDNAIFNFSVGCNSPPHKTSVGIHIAPKIILQAPKKLQYLEMATPLDRWEINMKARSSR